MAETYEIRWRGETYHASDLTDQIKHKYCVWLYNHMLDNAKRYKTAADYLQFERKLTARPPEWTSLPGWDVLSSFGDDVHPNIVARRYLNRLILNLDAETMTDDEFDEFIREKESDPSSDLNRAMKLIKEQADPKAPKGGHGSPRPKADNEPTPASATNP